MVEPFGPKPSVWFEDELALPAAKLDLKTISNIKGIGKKTAEKLIFELKDKIREFNIPDQGIAISSSFSDEAIEALRAIGFTYFQSKEAVETALTRVSKDASTQQIIKEALKDLEKK